MRKNRGGVFVADLRKLRAAPGPNVALLFCAVFLVMATYTMVYSRTGTGPDYSIHIARSASRIIFSDFYGTTLGAGRMYPLWAVTTAFFSRLGLGLNHAAALVATGCTLAVYLLSHKVLALFVGGQYNSWALACFALGLSLAGAITPPWISQLNYMVTGNLWHSPTTTFVKPFAVLAFFYFAFLWREYQREARQTMPAAHVAALALVLFLSVLAKPSFMQGFLPAVGIFLLIELIRAKGRNIKFCLQTALAFVPGVAWMLLQMLKYFSESFGVENAVGSGLAIRWVSATNYHPHFIQALVLGYAFPLFVLVAVAGREVFKNKTLWLAVLFAAVGYLESYGIQELGNRAGHANFTWARSMGMYCLFTVCGVVLLQVQRRWQAAGPMKRGQSAILSVGWVLFFLHVLFGVVYFISFFFMAPGDNHLSTLMPGGFQNS